MYVRCTSYIPLYNVVLRFRLDPDGKDGIEVVLLLLFVAFFPAIGFGAPACILATHHHLPFFRYFDLGNTFLNILFQGIMTFNMIMDWFTILLTCYFLLIHTNSTTNFLRVITEAW